MHGKLLGLAALMTATGAQAQPLDAAASDPVAMGWMQGAPPPADKQIRFDDWGFQIFPKTRWSFSNWRQFVPTVAIARGSTPADPLPRAERRDLDEVSFTPLGGTTPMTWRDAFAANYMDGVVVLHRGKIVYERYGGVLTPGKQHLAMSVTKSFVGTLAAILAVEGKLDPASPVTRYVPELAASGFGDATVRQVMDMTTGLKYDETYGNPNSDISRLALAGGLGPRPADYRGPEGFLAFAMTVPKAGNHGDQFKYRTVNTDVLAWIVARAGGATIPALIEAHFWSKLGMEQDAYMQIDKVGTPFSGGGLNTSLRDLARFGEMMRNGGKHRGKTIVPAAAVADIVKGGGKDDFAKANYATLPGWSYRNQWWISHNEHGAYMARGIHGQAIYIDPKAEMTIARYGSHPMAPNVAFDPISLPAYHAVAKHLMGKK